MKSGSKLGRVTRGSLTRNNGIKLRKRKFRLNTRENFLTVRFFLGCYRFSKEAAEDLLLRIFKSMGQNINCAHKLKATILNQQVDGLDYLTGSSFPSLLYL